ncbi:helix-turn-helix domain-containing protein [Actinoallomurus liliacearum]|uniref:Helix-turn-helix domain-containing protein n=1 Tax=Actinoallomurus liliacearum TaxID=1080073 RepID=A0ABP8TYG6_9ACTN
MTHVIRASGDKPWTFLTNHARALINIAHNPSTRLRDIADAIGITARAAQTIVNDLEESGYITRTRVGRRNHYSVDPTRPFRHPADAGHRIEGLLALFADHDHDRAATGPAPRNRRGRGDEHPTIADDHPSTRR